MSPAAADRACLARWDALRIRRVSIPGPVVEELVDALVDAFPQLPELREFARVHLHQHLDAETEGGLRRRCFELVAQFEGRGTLHDLLSAAARARPNHAALAAALRRAQIAAATERPTDAPGNFEIRRVVKRVLGTHEALHGFLVDAFPDLAREASSAWDMERTLTWLFQRAQHRVVFLRLREACPGEVERALLTERRR